MLQRGPILSAPREFKTVCREPGTLPLSLRHQARSEIRWHLSQPQTSIANAGVVVCDQNADALFFDAARLLLGN
jgi:hypothetical protein